MHNNQEVFIYKKIQTAFNNNSWHHVVIYKDDGSSNRSLQFYYT